MMDAGIILAELIDKDSNYYQRIYKIINNASGLDLKQYPINDLGMQGEDCVENKGKCYLLKFRYFILTIADKLASEVLLNQNNQRQDITWCSKENLSKLKLTPPGIKLYRNLKYL